jgi:hypothetical protein
LLLFHGERRVTRAAPATGEGPASRDAPPGAPLVYAPLRRPLFFWLWVAFLVSYVGTWVQNVAARAGEFVAAIGPLREARLREGAYRWDLFQDAADVGRFVEAFLVEFVVEHLRQHERVRSFHRGDTPPAFTHLVAGLGEED